jgi:hypothetical protein
MLMTSQQERKKLLQEYKMEKERNPVLATGLVSAKR